ncbi:MAG: hypothetical protein AAGI44_13440, partial [Pseudomonadota bacterium]
MFTLLSLYSPPGSPQSALIGMLRHCEDTFHSFILARIGPRVPGKIVLPECNEKYRMSNTFVGLS